MSEEPNIYDDGASIFQLFAHPSRLQILDELRRGEACVCHLQAVLERPQAYISQQLRVLREADVVVDDKDGLNVYYRIADARILRFWMKFWVQRNLPDVSQLALARIVHENGR